MPLPLPPPTSASPSRSSFNFIEVSMGLSPKSPGVSPACFPFSRNALNSTDWQSIEVYLQLIDGAFEWNGRTVSKGPNNNRRLDWKNKRAPCCRPFVRRGPTLAPPRLLPIAVARVSISSRSSAPASSLLSWQIRSRHSIT